MKDLGTLHYFLGVEALFDQQGLFPSQRSYITKVLRQSNMLGAKGVSSLMSSSTSLSQFSSDYFFDETLYKSVVGFLHYVAITMLDIAFAVGRVCQFMHRPTTLNWSAQKCILHYLKQTVNHSWFLHATVETPHVIFKPFLMQTKLVS